MVNTTSVSNIILSALSSIYFTWLAITSFKQLHSMTTSFGCHELSSQCFKQWFADKLHFPLTLNWHCFHVSTFMKSFEGWNQYITRTHSSRMCTAPLLTVSHSNWWGEAFASGCKAPWMQTPLDADPPQSCDFWCMLGSQAPSLLPPPPSIPWTEGMTHVLRTVKIHVSGGSRISPRLGVPTLSGGFCQHTILSNFPKNCMKLEEFGSPGGARPSRPHRSATACRRKCTNAPRIRLVGHVITNPKQSTGLHPVGALSLVFEKYSLLRSINLNILSNINIYLLPILNIVDNTVSVTNIYFSSNLHVPCDWSRDIWDTWLINIIRIAFRNTYTAQSSTTNRKKKCF